MCSRIASPSPASPEAASKQLSVALSTLKSAADKALGLRTVSGQTPAGAAGPSSAVGAQDATSGPSGAALDLAAAPSPRACSELVARASMQFASWCTKLSSAEHRLQEGGGEGEQQQPLLPCLQPDLKATLDAEGELSGWT